MESLVFKQILTMLTCVSFELAFYVNVWQLCLLGITLAVARSCGVRLNIWSNASIISIYLESQNLKSLSAKPNLT